MPERKRGLCDLIRSVYGLAVNRACRLSGLPRSMFYHPLKGNPLNEVLSKQNPGDLCDPREARLPSAST